MMTEIERRFAESEGRPVSLVFTGKFGREVFVCTDVEEAYGFCLSVLWQRYHSGHYFDEEKKELPPPPLTKDQIDRMPDGETKQGAINEWVIYENGLRWHHDATHEMKQVKQALAQRSGALAFAILYGRRNDEYEEFEILPAEQPATLPEGDLLQEKPEHTYFL